MSRKNSITTAKRGRVEDTSKDLSIIIPAAGMGKRMKSYGPKALIEINKNGTTIIERQINLLWKVYPGAEIFVVIGFEGEKIRKSLQNYPVRIIHNPIHESSNVLFSIGLAAQAVLAKEMMIVYGDLIFNESSIKNLRGKESKIVIDESGLLKKEEVGVAIENDFVRNLSFGLQTKWAQIAYFMGKELELFKEVSVRKECSQWFGYEAINHVLEMGGVIKSTSSRHNKLIEIDAAKDLEKLDNQRLTFG